MDEQAKDEHHLHVVMPEATWQKLKRIAKRNRRSVSAQILCLIDWSLREEPDEPNAPSR